MTEITRRHALAGGITLAVAAGAGLPARAAAPAASVARNGDHPAAAHAFFDDVVRAAPLDPQRSLE